MVSPWIDSSAAIEEKAVPISDRAAVAATRAGQREREGRGGGQSGADRDREEVHGAGDLNLGLAEEVNDGGGQHRAAREQAEEGHRPLPSRWAIPRYRTRPSPP